MNMAWISLNRSSFLGEGIGTTYLFPVFIYSLNIPKLYENSENSEIEMWWTPAYDYYMLSSSISFCCLQGTDICPLHCSYTLYGLSLLHYIITLFYVRHRQHYTWKIKHFGKWVHYDGVTEKQCPESGLSVQHILAQLGTPSHCF